MTTSICSFRPAIACLNISDLCGEPLVTIGDAKPDRWSKKYRVNKQRWKQGI